MSHIQAKICGLTHAHHVATALLHEAAFLGFVTFPNSPRHISPTDARPLAKMATGLARTVSVLVNPDALLIDAVLKDLKPDYIQLHGTETPEYCAQLRRRGVGVIKAFGISKPSDLTHLAAYHGHVDMILFDAKPPQNAAMPGGLGHAFDWTILQNLTLSIPWFLSGGLNSANIAQAVAITGAKMVDVSSGVEMSPGLKHDALIAAFMAALKTDA